MLLKNGGGKRQIPIRGPALKGHKTDLPQICACVVIDLEMLSRYVSHRPSRFSISPTNKQTTSPKP